MAERHSYYVGRIVILSPMLLNFSASKANPATRVMLCICSTSSFTN